MRTPTWIEDRFRSDFGPDSIVLKLQPSIAFFAGFQRKELRCQLENAVVMRVKGESNDLITSHVHRWWWSSCLWSLGLPPRTRCKGIKLRVTGTERERLLGLCADDRCHRPSPKEQCSQFQEQATSEVHRWSDNCLWVAEMKGSLTAEHHLHPIQAEVRRRQLKGLDRCTSPSFQCEASSRSGSFGRAFFLSC